MYEMHLMWGAFHFMGVVMMRRFYLLACLVVLLCGCAKSESDEVYFVPSSADQETAASGEDIYLVKSADIELDGDFSDWEGIEPFLVEPSDVPGQDLVRMYMVHSATYEDYVFMRVDTQMELSFSELVNMFQPEFNDQGAFLVTIKFPGNNYIEPYLPTVIRGSGSVACLDIEYERVVGHAQGGASSPEGVEFGMPLAWLGPYTTVFLGFSDCYIGAKPDGLFMTDLVEVNFDGK